MEHTQLVQGRRDVLKKVGLLGALGALGLMKTAKVAHAADATGDELNGMWDMTVVGTQTYLYVHSISRGAWTATGNIDHGFFNFAFGPTMGTYVRRADGSYAYREKGWTYQRAGGPHNGRFETVGTFTLDPNGNTFRGPGVFTMYDLQGRAIIVENLTVVATRVSV